MTFSFLCPIYRVEHVVRFIFDKVVHLMLFLFGLLFHFCNSKNKVVLIQSWSIIPWTFLRSSFCNRSFWRWGFFAQFFLYLLLLFHGLETLFNQIILFGPLSFFICTISNLNNELCYGQLVLLYIVRQHDFILFHQFGQIVWIRLLCVLIAYSYPPEKRFAHHVPDLDVSDFCSSY